jgi:aspartate aminotransferase/aminotransferase
MDINPCISDRCNQINASGIRKIFDLAANVVDPVNFSIGQPHFDVDPLIKEEAVKAIEEGFNKYTPSGGIPPLKEKIAAREPELTANGRDLMITAGVSGGIVLAFLSLINPGDEVLIPDPGFVSYKHVVRMAGGIPVFFDTYPDFRLHPENIEKCITPKTKLFILNSPSNPTGIVYTPEEIKTAAEICKKHSILPVSDEIYRAFSYDGKADSILDHFEETVILRGFSKDYAMTGWRMGYASAPAELITEMTKLQQFSFVNAPSFAQKACIAALDTDISDKINDYRKKRDLVYDALKDVFEVTKPEGAFYCFPRSPQGTGTEFVTKAIDQNLLMVPGGSFSEKDTHFRISFATDDEKLKQGLEILKNLA